MSSLKKLKKDVRDTKSGLQSSSAEALAEFGIEAVPALVGALNYDYYVQCAASSSLVKIGVEAVPALCQVVEGPSDSSAQIASAEALGEIGHISAVPVLCRALGHCRFDTPIGNSRTLCSETIAKALGKIGHVSAVPALCRALGYEEYRAVEAATDALVTIGVGSVPGLCQALNDGDDMRSERVAKVLGQIGDIRSIPALCQALNNARWNPPFAEALNQIGVVSQLPLKVVVATHIPVADRIAALEAMARASTQKRATLQYNVESATDYCEQLLRRDDIPEAVKVQARNILAHQTLVRAGLPHLETPSNQLVRPSAENPVNPTEALRPSEEPQDSTPPLPPRKSRIMAALEKIVPRG